MLVPAEIVYVQRVPEKNTFRYGAQSVPTATERSRVLNSEITDRD